MGRQVDAQFVAAPTRPQNRQKRGPAIEPDAARNVEAIVAAPHVCFVAGDGNRAIAVREASPAVRPESHRPARATARRRSRPVETLSWVRHSGKAESAHGASPRNGTVTPPPPVESAGFGGAGTLVDAIRIRISSRFSHAVASTTTVRTMTVAIAK